MQRDSGSTGLPITYARFSAAFVPEAPLRLPIYTGSMFRGAFGSALKHAVCVTRTYDCGPCLLRQRCLYPYVFETAPPPDTRVMRKYTAAPHPFIFEPPAGGVTAPAANPLRLGITLLGKAIASLPHFVFALEQLGWRGLGGRRVRCALSSVDGLLDGRRWLLYSSHDRITRAAEAFQEDMLLPLRPGEALGEKPVTERMTIEILTPLRLGYDSHLATELPFHVLLRSLLRRLGHLSYFHCGGDPSRVAFREWIEMAADIETVEHDLQWFDWERYSNRQQTTMSLGGLIGRVTFAGNLTPFTPFLTAGEILHAGKGTSFGLGRFRINF